MIPEYLIFNLRDISNKEMFIAQARVAGFTPLTEFQWRAIPFQPEIVFQGREEDKIGYVGGIEGNDLYIISDSILKKYRSLGLEKLARSFELK